jgi:hypothetical protein
LNRSPRRSELVTTYPGPYSVSGVALTPTRPGPGSAVAALELYARAVRAQALAHERQTTARLDAELQDARHELEAQIEPHSPFNTLATVRQRSEPTR